MSAQDMLTDELVGMAEGMKSNTLAMEGQLRQRATLLDDTEEAMEHSLQQARKGKQRAKEIHSRWALLLLRCTTMVVLLVRVTRELQRRGAPLLSFHKGQRSNVFCCSLHSSMNASHTCVEFHHQARGVSTAQAQRRLCRNRIGFCKTCLALLLVACVFLAMYGYIRVTYMIGFKH